MQVSVENKIDSRQLLAKFLQNPQAVLNGIPQTGASAGLKEKLYLLYEHVPELLREGKIGEAKILVDCNRKVGQAPELLQEPQKYSEFRDAALTMVNAQPSAIFPFLQSMGRVGWQVVAELCGHETPGVRQLACKLLTGAGEKAVPLLLDVYEKEKGPEFLKSMLTVLGGVSARGDSVLAFYKNTLRHPDPALRKMAIAALVKADPREAEELLIPLLTEKDQGVLVAAVKGLESTGINSPEVVQFVLDVISGYLKPSDELFLQTVRMLRKIDAKPFNGTSLAQDLNEYIGRRGFFSFGSKGPSVSREVQLEVIITLGKVGNFINNDKLEQLKGDKDLVMAKTAADALGEINRRK